MKAALLAAVASLITVGAAWAADKPCYQWGINTDCIQQHVMVAPTANGSLAPLGVPGNPIAVSTPASAAPTALTPTAIAAANTYQQAAPAGAATNNGGIVQAASTNTGSICVDTTSSAAAGRTTATGGQVCATPGGSVTFPATPGGVFVFGTTAGDKFSGSAS